MKERLYVSNKVGGQFYIHVKDFSIFGAILYIPDEYVHVDYKFVKDKETRTTICTSFFTFKESITYIEFPLKNTSIVEIKEHVYTLKSAKGINTFYFYIEGQKGTDIIKIKPKPITTLNVKYPIDNKNFLLGKLISVDSDTIILGWECKREIPELDLGGDTIVSLDERIEEEFVYPIYYK